MKFNYNNPIAYGFIESYKKYPENKAIFVNNRYYSYKELFKIVSSIYHGIQKKYSKHERIAVFDFNDLYSHASILAISLANKTYIPLNPYAPFERNVYIIREAQIGCVFTSDAVVSDSNAELAVSKSFRYKEGITIEYNDAKEDSLAYIIFTSGSTGAPKGVTVSNSNVNHALKFFIDSGLFKLDDKDRFLQMYELTFDVSVFSFFLPLMIGACTYIVPRKKINYLAIASMMDKHNITVSSMVPSILHFFKPYFNEIRLPSLKYSFFSGDVLWHDIAESWSHCITNAKIVNFYGPTETTIVCTYYFWNKETSRKESVNGIVPLGKPFKNMRYLIVDENNIPVKEGEKGELCFTGKQVISNYLNNLHKELFFISKTDSKRYYKTGDIASLNSKGNLVFHGRNDNQVKINGYRVELSEINYHINTFTNNKLSIVIAKPNEKGVNVIHAFVEDFNDIVRLNNYLKTKLPVYMLPKNIYSTKRLPLNKNGKVDKQALINMII